MEGENKSVTVLGCGWIGLPLAERLIGNGHLLKGTTTTMGKVELLSQKQIMPYVVNFSTDEELETALFESSTLVVAFPPKTKSTSGEWYLAAIKKIKRYCEQSPVKRLVFLSSTSIYPDFPMEMQETFNLERHTGNEILFKAEHEIGTLAIPTFILRLGGLAGDDRFLAHHFSGKEGLRGAKHPVNLLHKTDAIAIIAAFVEQEWESGIYNICAPLHPTKKELYTHDCLRFGLPIPKYGMDMEDGKTISVEKFLSQTKYEFVFPDPLFFTYQQP